jgi:hypothetical protein
VTQGQPVPGLTTSVAGWHSSHPAAVTVVLLMLATLAINGLMEADHSVCLAESGTGGAKTDLSGIALDYFTSPQFLFVILAAPFVAAPGLMSILLARRTWVSAIAIALYTVPLLIAIHGFTDEKWHDCDRKGCLRCELTGFSWLGASALALGLLAMAFAIYLRDRSMR